jgi:hypothetical protein
VEASTKSFFVHLQSMVVDALERQCQKESRRMMKTQQLDFSCVEREQLELQRSVRSLVVTLVVLLLVGLMTFSIGLQLLDSCVSKLDVLVQHRSLVSHDDHVL